MAEFSGYMYAVGTPMPIYPRRRSKQRSNSASTNLHGLFRSHTHHTRTSSHSAGSSQASRSSHETVSSSLQKGQQGQHQHQPQPQPQPQLQQHNHHHHHHPQPDRPAAGSIAGASPDRPDQQQPPADDPRASVSTGSSIATGAGAPASTSPPVLSSSASSVYSFASRQASERRASIARSQQQRHRRPTNIEALSALDLKNVAMSSEHEAGKPSSSHPKQVSLSFGRTESVSSTSGQTSLSTPTMTSSDPSASGDFAAKPFVLRNGRTYLNDPNIPYCLPSDLTEMHRQSLRTLLLIQVFGAPICSPATTTKPPQKVLEMGCGSGFWSMMCHRYFKGRGHGGISFTGIDMAPLAPGSANTPADTTRPDRDMKWKFIQHDLRQFPWPLADEEFDLIMVKDLALATTRSQYQTWVDEYLRILKPGGTLEIWESDLTFRMLRPHVPSGTGADDSDEQEAASSLGAYIMSANTPLSPPLNTYLVEYNNWITRALESRDISPVPCTLIGPALLQESEGLTDVRSRRMAIPLSEVRWEREGVGGVVTKDGKSYVEMKGKGAPHQKVEKKTLTAGQAALRKTALLTVVQQVQALEPVLREVSGKSIDEWDMWLGKMMGDLMSESGTSWGECLEVGAWWAKKMPSR